MKYGDFSSIVQLGVGLHVGTAVLQLYGELGVQPLVRAISRTRSLFLAPVEEQPSSDIRDELSRLESRYEIFRIRLFNEYRKYVFVNSVVAVVLAAILVLLAYKSDDAVIDGWEAITVFFVSLSILPAPVSLAALWWDANRQLLPLKEAADELERRATASG